MVPGRFFVDCVHTTDIFKIDSDHAFLSLFYMICLLQICYSSYGTWNSHTSRWFWIIPLLDLQINGAMNRRLPTLSYYRNTTTLYAYRKQQTERRTWRETGTWWITPATAFPTAHEKQVVRHIQSGTQEKTVFQSTTQWILMFRWSGSIDGVDRSVWHYGVCGEHMYSQTLELNNSTKIQQRYKMVLNDIKWYNKICFINIEK